jgi:RNA polymerase sigma-70 factor (ECF subfamily)
MRLPFTSSARSSKTTEAWLIERCRGGDLTAFDELMAQHQNRVYNLCFWLLRDPEAASDATQEVFIRAFRALKNFRGDCAFSTWLHRIAVNIATDQANRRQRTPVPLSTLEHDDSTFPEPAAPGDDPGTSFMRKERRKVVREALETLPDHHRLVLVLFDIQGYAYEEIAEILELPMGTVKSRLNRARAALREKLEPCRELFED